MVKEPKAILCLVLLFISTACLNGQSKFNAFLKPSDTLNKNRRNTVIIAESILGTSALIGLNQLWYADFERSKLHTINDNNEWMQMDKVGHVFASYQMGRLGADLLAWSGVGKGDQLIYGSTLGLGFLTVVEVFDGHSKEWGFSWGDIAANIAGTGLYVGQELLWQEQRILLKYSFHQTKYADIRPERLGNNFLEQALKDYNGQTYWLSANLKSFFKSSKTPNWINIAFGYGADGMLTGDIVLEVDGRHTQDRVRQYYLSLDIDLDRLQTKPHFLRTIFSVLNLIKVPAPTLEINSKGKLKLHPIYF